MNFQHKSNLGLGLSKLLQEQTNIKMQSEYTIRELSNEFCVTLRALHYYEGEGLLVPKRRSGARIYNSKDRIRLQLILMGKRFGFSLLEIQEILETNDLEHVPKEKIEEIIYKFKSQLFVLEEKSRLLKRAQDELNSAIDIIS